MGLRNTIKEGLKDLLCSVGSLVLIFGIIFGSGLIIILFAEATKWLAGIPYVSIDDAVLFENGYAVIQFWRKF